MNIVLSVLYAEGFWIPAQMAHRLGIMIRKFLLTYQQCAVLAYRENLNRFGLTPKAHMIAHTGEELIANASKAGSAGWVPNPLAESNQVQEDFIGKPSRLSRRVRPARMHLRVMERSLLACYQVLFG